MDGRSPHDLPSYKPATLTIDYPCQCGRVPGERCFRRTDHPAGQCFACSVGNCGPGKSHGYGSEDVHIEVVRVEPSPATRALEDAVAAVLQSVANLDLHPRPVGFKGHWSDTVPVEAALLQRLRLAWRDYIASATK